MNEMFRKFAQKRRMQWNVLVLHVAASYHCLGVTGPFFAIPIRGNGYQHRYTMSRLMVFLIQNTQTATESVSSEAGRADQRREWRARAG